MIPKASRIRLGFQDRSSLEARSAPQNQPKRNSKNPAIARVLGGSQVQRGEDKVSLEASITESDLAALIQTHSLALRF